MKCLNWNFENTGIGGLDKKLKEMFSRALAARVFPTEIIKQLGTEVFLCDYFYSEFLSKIFELVHFRIETKKHKRDFSLWTAGYRQNLLGS